jgi:Protein of unknown function (DUF1161)
MIRSILALAALALPGSPSFAETCEAISAQIEAKVRAGGVEQFTLTTVDTDAKVMGKVVGSCDLGKKKIVYVKGAVPVATTGRAVPTAATPAVRAAPAPTKKQEAILTECRDGTVSMGGDCKK